MATLKLLDAVEDLLTSLDELYGPAQIHRVTLDVAESGIVSYRVFVRHERWPLAGELGNVYVQTTIPDEDGA
jgi:hypothetical protein